METDRWIFTPEQAREQIADFVTTHRDGENGAMNELCTAISVSAPAEVLAQICTVLEEIVLQEQELYTCAAVLDGCPDTDDYLRMQDLLCTAEKIMADVYEELEHELTKMGYLA